MSLDQLEIIWIVVLVKSGIPVLAEAYKDEETALKREEVLRKDLNLDYDETGVFEVKIGEQYFD